MHTHALVTQDQGGDSAVDAAAEAYEDTFFGLLRIAAISSLRPARLR